MNKQKKYIILSKDAMCTDYLKCYSFGKECTPTPNIDELAENGTVFTNYYAAGASTVMAFYSMCTGQYSFQSNTQVYERKSKPYDGDTLFTKLKEIGYTQRHIIWSDGWETLPKFEDYFHNDVELHTINHLSSLVVGKNVSEDSNVDGQLAEQFLHKIEKIIVDILAKGERTFIWLHLPHVIAGRARYGSDMDLFDRYVGMVRKYFQDDEITITADHGNMNGHRGKLAYAYDVYDPVVRIPFIRPRVGECTCARIMFLQLNSIILYSRIWFQRRILFTPKLLIRHKSTESLLYCIRVISISIIRQIIPKNCMIWN